MARPLIISDLHNGSNEELKQLSRVAASETATRCSAIQMLLAGISRALVCDNEEKLIERLDQAILDVIDNPERAQQTAAIGTLF